MCTRGICIPWNEPNSTEWPRMSQEPPRMSQIWVILRMTQNWRMSQIWSFLAHSVIFPIFLKNDPKLKNEPNLGHSWLILIFQYFWRMSQIWVILGSFCDFPIFLKNDPKLKNEPNLGHSWLILQFIIELTKTSFGSFSGFWFLWVILRSFIVLAHSVVLLAHSCQWVILKYFGSFLIVLDHSQNDPNLAHSWVILHYFGSFLSFWLIIHGIQGVVHQAIGACVTVYLPLIDAIKIRVLPGGRHLSLYGLVTGEILALCWRVCANFWW